jgi:PAS domain S-box-containing protein
MSDRGKTKLQLMQDLKELRLRNIELERLVTEGKRVEDALRETQNTQKALLNAPSDVILLLDLNGSIMDANGTAALRMSKPVDQLIGSCIWDLLPPDLSRSRKAYAGRVIESGQPVRFEDERYGTWFDNVVYPICDEIGKVVRIAVVARDITERKQMEEALRRGELELRLITDNIRDTVWLMDLDLQTTWISPSVFKNRGYTMEEITRTPPDRHLTLDSLAKARRTAQKLLTPERLNSPTDDISAAIELEFYRKDGTTFWSDVAATVLRDSKGLPTGILCLGRDISERKRMEDDLKEALTRYKEATSTAENLSQENLIIAKIGRIIGSSLDIEEVYESFAQEVKQLIPFDGIAINIIHPEEQKVSVPYVSGPEIPGCQKGEDFPLEGSITAEMMSTRSGLILQAGDLAGLSEKFPTLEKGFEQGLKSLIVVPLISKDTVIGALHIRSMTHRDYAWREMDLAEKVGFQIAEAIAKAQLFEEWRLTQEALRDSEKKYRLIAENVTDVIWTMDLNFNFNYVSPSITKLRGFTVQEAIRQSLSEFLTPLSLEAAFNAIDEEVKSRAQNPQETDRRLNIELEQICKDGSTVWTENEINYIHDQGRKMIGIVGLTRDISERKRFEEAMRKSEERFRSLIQSSSDIILILDDQGRVTYQSPSLERISGYPGDHFIGKSPLTIVHPDDLDQVQKKLNEVFQALFDGMPINFRGRKADGSWVFLEAVASNHMDIPSIGGLVVNIRDITERKKAEEALKGSEERLRLLSNRLINAQEKERKRIAYELHDELGQSLIGLKFQLTGLQKKSKMKADGFHQEITQALNIIDGMSVNIRQVSQELRPSVLQHLGLLEALDWLFEDYKQKSHAAIFKKIGKHKRKFSKHQEIMIFRIFQEALTNIGKHAEAKQVTVTITEDEKGTFFSIQDNGKGFDLKNIEIRDPRETGLGLISMKERALMAGGDFDIKSEDERGTLVTFWVPLSRSKKRSSHALF